MLYYLASNDMLHSLNLIAHLSYGFNLNLLSCSLLLRLSELTVRAEQSCFWAYSSVTVTAQPYSFW